MISTTNLNDIRKASESQRVMSYNKHKVVPVMVRLNKESDKDIIEFLEALKGHKATNIKIILRKYMKKC